MTHQHQQLPLSERRQNGLHLGFLLFAGLAVGLITGSFSNPLLIFVFFGALAVGAAMFLHVSWGLALLIFIIFTNFSDVANSLHELPSISKILTPLILILVMSRWLIYNERPGISRQALWIIALYGLVMSISLFTAAKPEKVLSALGEFGKDAILVLVITSIVTNGERLKQVIWALLAAMFFLGSIAAVQYLTGAYDSDFWGFARADIHTITQEVESFRLAGSLGDANIYAQILLIIAPLAMERVKNESRPAWRVLAGGTLILCLFSIMLTYSRGAAVALIIILGIAAYLYPPKRSTLILLLAITPLSIPLLPASYTDRLVELVEMTPSVKNSTGPDDIAIEGRLGEMIAAWQMFKDNPILGVGAGHYSMYFQGYTLRLNTMPRGEKRDAHSLYLEIAAEKGVMGLSVFALVVWTAARNLWQARAAFREAGLHEYKGIAEALGLGLFGFLLAGIFLHLSYPQYLWLQIGIALSLPAVVAHECSRISTPLPKNDLMGTLIKAGGL
jgi:O-antigen ligase